MADTLPAIETFIMGRLQGSSTLMQAVSGRIYADMSPQPAVRPYVVFSFQGWRSFGGLDGGDNAVRAEYLVKVVGEFANSASVQDLSGMVKDILHKSKGGGDGVIIHECVRDAPIQYPEIVEGKTIYHCGAQYHIWAE